MKTIHLLTLLCFLSPPSEWYKCLLLRHDGRDDHDGHNGHDHDVTYEVVVLSRKERTNGERTFKGGTQARCRSNDRALSKGGRMDKRLILFWIIGIIIS